MRLEDACRLACTASGASAQQQQECVNSRCESKHIKAMTSCWLNTVVITMTCCRWDSVPRPVSSQLQRRRTWQYTLGVTTTQRRLPPIHARQECLIDRPTSYIAVIASVFHVTANALEWALQLSSWLNGQSCVCAVTCNMVLKSGLEKVSFVEIM